MELKMTSMTRKLNQTETLPMLSVTLSGAAIILDKIVQPAQLAYKTPLLQQSTPVLDYNLL